MSAPAEYTWIFALTVIFAFGTAIGIGRQRHVRQQLLPYKWRPHMLLSSGCRLLDIP